jgi:flagellar motility protein MotE (MotC chaperone)
MVRSRINLVLVGVCAALSACAQQVQQKEDMLAAAGFTPVPANTPQRQASLAALPSHKFTHQVRNNVAVITYADPTVCDCLYVGNQAAYDSYRQAVKAKNMAAAEEADAKLADWGVWPALGP